MALKIEPIVDNFFQDDPDAQRFITKFDSLGGGKEFALDIFFMSRDNPVCSVRGTIDRGKIKIKILGWSIDHSGAKKVVKDMIKRLSKEIQVYLNTAADVETFEDRVVFHNKWNRKHVPHVYWQWHKPWTWNI
ncbi:MAG: hypothetical protein WCY93_08685 [Anaerolineaceae bacterium]